MPTKNINFGKPCWDYESVQKVISSYAQTNEASAARFLAAHSPFQKIIDGKTNLHSVTEEDIFNELFIKSKAQVQAFVKGEPGTGKSHLIRWLKERSGYESRLNKGRTDHRRVVLVTRGNGSLKDALAQIVNQLGKEFERHIKRVQGAIDRLSDSTARATLLSELALEVGVRWSNERGRNPLCKSLCHLGDALNSTKGFGEWIKRDGGVIHSVIKRLSDSSTLEERETFPAFSPKDFELPNKYLTPQYNPGDVIDLGIMLAEEPDVRALAAQVLNTALQDAIRSMTGLWGNDLLEIFTEIRRELGPKSELVVLVEDVTVMQLNLDVINAFERKDDVDLCRMIAVLGIADSGWEQLPVNQRDRASHIYEVGGQTASQWAGDREEIAKFTARYLNAIRSTEEELQDIARERFNSDIQKSACDDCRIRQECHSAFGKVKFENGAEVGMFPFTKNAPYALLQNLTESKYKSQRGLLDRVLLNALDRSYDNLQSARFPQTVMFPVNVPSSMIWTGFENRYCGGGAWDSEKKIRLRFLSQFWVVAENSDEIANGLNPLLTPLGFPDFSTLVKKGGVVSGGGVIVDPPRSSPPEDKELKRLLSLLDKWIEGQNLSEDNKFRELLSKFLHNCIVWQDNRDIPITEEKRLIANAGSRVPFIEGQTRAPGGTNFRINFERNQETLALLQGLLMFSRSNGNWNFIDGELHKRNVSIFLRRHKTRFINNIKPEPQTLSREALRSAVQALALTTLLRDRKKLPEGRSDRMAAIFTPCWDNAAKPVVLSKELEIIVDDLAIKNSKLRDFLVNELGVGQGDSNPSDFLNPVPILNILREFENKIQFDPPSSNISESYWGPRFDAVKSFSNSFDSFINSLEKEMQTLGEAVTFIRNFVTAAGFPTENLRDGMESCLCELAALIELQQGVPRRDGVLPINMSDGVKDLWQKKYLQDSEKRTSWGACISRALDLSAGVKIYELATFNVNKLKECIYMMRLFDDHLEVVDRELILQEQQVGVEGDSRSQFLDGLDEITALLGNGEKTGCDVE